MKRLTITLLTLLMSTGAWAKSFETESGRKYKEFSEGEFINQDKWFDRIERTKKSNEFRI
jgi:hypothetical protein